MRPCVCKVFRKTYVTNGEKISHFEFPSDKALRQKWIQAIRRDVGDNFVIVDRHTKWKQDSPRKRKAPKERRVLSPKKPCPSHSNSNTEPTCIEPKTKEFACQTNITLAEFNNVSENSSRLPKLLDNTKSLNETVTELQDQIRCNEIMINKLEENVGALNDQLKKKAEKCYALNDEFKSMTEKCQKSERKNERFFSVNKFLNDNPAMLFYTGFPNAEIFESYLEFLQPGKNGENIKYKNASYADNNYSRAKPDKGFLIQDLLQSGVSLNMPPFVGDQVQFSANDTVDTQSIASLRVHVERAINKIKSFHIWNRSADFISDINECVKNHNCSENANCTNTEGSYNCSCNPGFSGDGHGCEEHALNLSKKEFRDAVKLRYDWPFDDIPSVCASGENLTIDHAMICKRRGFVIQRHNELRDLEADLLNIVCTDVEVEPVLQGITKEQLSRGYDIAQDAGLDVRARGFWYPQSSAFFDVRVCHPNAESYKDQEPQQFYRIHENDKKRLYSRRVLDVEHGSFTPLVFTTTGGMGMECIRYHSRLAELIAAKKGERYSQTISWIRAKTSFALLRSALVCLRGSRSADLISDINECVQNNGCSENANCTNTEGSYNCSCNPGFSGDGHKCEDIDECAHNTHNCSRNNATCTNTEGSHNCSCDPGFTGDGHICQDIDECAHEIHNCSMDSATCKNTEGSFCLSMQDPRDCAEVYSSGKVDSGVYTIKPSGSRVFDVFCNQTIAGGGWTVFQRKLASSFSFDKVWDKYKEGFGNLSGDLWLGTKKLHRLAKHGVWQIRVDWEKWEDNRTHFVEFSVKVLSDHRLSVKDQLKGDHWDPLKNGEHDFRTRDRKDKGKCAEVCKMGWWYTNDCSPDTDCPIGKDNSTKRVEMKIKKK
ncbi:Angiopoietin-related protein 3 [Stylophora pistillata]|uniref:Angiopoietin-related protein 3 n=1 Tax=Stylophora pistillata TaxID=50429 RepID=A0A2B4R3M7_STYPI|nr:Angiopoietin-related protein 3 [Stylophora pistillata]